MNVLAIVQFVYSALLLAVFLVLSLCGNQGTKCNETLNKQLKTSSVKQNQIAPFYIRIRIHMVLACFDFYFH